MKQATVSVRTYALTFVALLALALVTSLIGMIDLGPFSLPVAVTIATMKAVLIAAFFMQALYGAKQIRIILAGGVIWFLIMVTLTLGDYMTRGWVSALGGK